MLQRSKVVALILRMPPARQIELRGRLQTVLASLDDTLDRVATFRGNVAGTVCINGPRLAAALLVRDVLPLLTVRCRDVTVDIVAGGQLIAIVSSGSDAGMRLMEAIPRNMITVSTANLTRFACVVSPCPPGCRPRRRWRCITLGFAPRHRRCGHFCMPSRKQAGWVSTPDHRAAMDA
jgi:DNA-binding transcriptional LysR family regulator